MKLNKLYLYFDENGILDFLNISLLLEGLKPTWADWSVEREMRIKNLNDKWLEECIGKPSYNFYWGNIWSRYDAKAGSSYIEVKYNKL